MVTPAKLRGSVFLLLAFCSVTVVAEDAKDVSADSKSESKATDPAAIQFFESKVRPVLLDYCADCHGADTQESDLRVDTPAHLLLGGKSGPLTISGQPDRSLLISAIRYQDEALQMPPDEKLPANVIADLVKWVEMGAPVPATDMVVAKTRLPFDLSEARKHWAFQTPQRPPVPETERAQELSNPIDRFIQAKREEKKLTAAAKASKRTLIRRAYLDLIGLPPTPAQVQAFLNDQRSDAFHRVVEELLASPHYGERWGRHWLDIARYADSNGLDENVAHGNAWRYRDYVIAAFNADKPFDLFVREQIAGDLLAGDQAANHDQLIATGFLSLGPKVLAESDKTKMLMDIIDEQIDTTGRVFLALTFGCARCHDHKFDPIRADDYYALAGIFKSTHTMESLKTIAKWNEHVIASPEQLEEKQQHDAKVAALEAQIAAIEKALKERQQTEKTTARVDATGETVAVEESATDAETKTVQEDDLPTLKATLKELKEKAPELPTAMGVRDSEPVDVPIHVRGSHLSLGRDVSRGVPLVLASTDDPTLKQPEQSGRLELANWLASPDHPLTSRVWVNRVWRWHFGEGLVATVDNFGILGQRPSHPELLDWLAVEFVEQGWSVKELHRLIMTSETYQMSSAYDLEDAELDPENVYYWRMNKQRMEAEVFRDSILAVSGQLDRTMGGSMLHVKNREFIFNHTSKDETNYDTTRRSIYLPVIRNNLYVGFSLFDYTDASVPNGNRETSTVAPQALYALNSDFIMNAAAKLAEKLLSEHAESADRIRALFENTFGRLPSNSEISVIEGHLEFMQSSLKQTEQLAWASLCQTFLISNEFIYVE